jgi:ribosome biogenesis protein ERB1
MLTILYLVWEIATGRCVKVVNCGGTVRSVAWCPNQNLPLIVVAADQKVLLINPGVGDHVISKKADKLLEIIPQSDVIGNYYIYCLKHLIKSNYFILINSL